MALRYAKRFAVHEAEILRDIRLHGFMGAMAKWDARDYVSWSNYVKSLQSKPLLAVEPADIKGRL